MPRFFHPLHLPFLCVDKSKNLNRVLALRIINDWIAKFISFFIPIFLYGLGQNLVYPGPLALLNQLSSFQKGVVLMALYSALLRGLILILSLPLGKLVARHGTRLGLLANLFFQTGYLLFLLLSRQSLWFLYPAALFQAIHIYLLNTIYFTLFALFSLKKHVGEDLSLAEFILQLVSVAVPAIGGVIIVQFGYDLLFLSSLIGIGASFAMTLLMDPITFKIAPAWSEFRSWLKNRPYQKVLVSYVGRYVNDGALGLWPIYVLIFAGSIEKVGFAYSLSLFFSMIIIFFTGIYFDHHKSHKPFLISGSLLSSLWLVRMSVTNILSAVIVDTLDKLAGSFHWLFFDAMAINGSKGDRALSFFTYRELIMSVSGVIFWLLVAGVFVLPMGWYSLFALGAVGMILTLFMNDHRQDLS